MILRRELLTPKMFKMKDIMDLINDPLILERLEELETLTRKIKLKIYFYNGVSNLKI